MLKQILFKKNACFDFIAFVMSQKRNNYSSLALLNEAEVMGSVSWFFDAKQDSQSYSIHPPNHLPSTLHPIHPSSIQPPICYPSIHPSFIPSILQPIHLPSIHAFVHSSIHPSDHHLSINPSTQPSANHPPFHSFIYNTVTTEPFLSIHPSFNPSMSVLEIYRQIFHRGKNSCSTWAV